MQFTAKLSFVLSLTLLISCAFGQGPTIDRESCALTGVEGLDPDVVQQMLDEAFDMSANIVRLADTTNDYWDERVSDIFYWMINGVQNSPQGRLTKGTSVRRVP